ncbi:hypothetical protein FSST1_012953 [Fusarium sambucinum]
MFADFCLPITRSAPPVTLEKRLSRLEAEIEATTNPLATQATSSTAHNAGSNASVRDAIARSVLPRAETVPGQSARSNLTFPKTPQDVHPSHQGQKSDTIQPQWRTEDEIAGLKLSSDGTRRITEAFSDDTSWQHNFIPMFSKPEVLLLVEFYLDHVTPLIPLFDRHSLLTRCENEFPVTCNTWDPAWWSCLNAIVGTALQMKTLGNHFQSVGPISWSFFKNAFAVFPQLMQTGSKAMSAKGLVSMAMFLSGTADSKTMMRLLLAASKQIQILNAEVSSQDTILIEEIDRIISVAYLLDEASSGNCGFRSSFDAIANSRLIDITQKMRQDHLSADRWTFFKPRLELALIECKAQRYLEIVKSSCRISEGQIKALMQDLDDWRLRVPPEIRPQYKYIPGLEPTDLGVVMLHCAFYRTIDVVHRAYHLFMLCQVTTTSPSAMLRLVKPEPLDSSRMTIRLFCHMEEIGFVDLWRLLPFLLCSAITIHVYIVQHPHEKQTINDMALIGSLRKFICTMKNKGFELDSCLALCTELERVALDTITNFSTSDSAFPIDTIDNRSSLKTINFF